ncbi:type VI secretion system tube protein Hcp [Catenovulum sp. SM1970]|uniref:Hcp family type VI secretion system effector n=1 Tax=Marinifaba aquimaris TaxID=2741323 RepID=UPI00157260B5|nr:type VI secretion system tube protein Hcp [Marinifaba aquimaris]NTS75654.1 type VI secretion system tube protein Hcp [Marinifaba aquimaris]
MAADMFLVLEGIKGESEDKAYKDQIDILAWSWGLSQTGTLHQGKGGGAGKANFQDISITKYVDNSTATLMNKIATGEHIATAKLVVRKAGGNPLEYFVIELKEVMVTSYSTGGSGGEDRLTENVTLNFAKIKSTYKTQKDDGTGGAAVEFKWDVPGNVPA